MKHFNKPVEKTYIDNSFPQYAVLNQQINRLQEIKEQIEKLEKEKDEITKNLFLQKHQNNFQSTIVLNESQLTFVENNYYTASDELFQKLKNTYGLDSQFFKHTVNTNEVRKTEFANELTITPKKPYVTIKEGK